jgi:hypothetical protein
VRNDGIERIFGNRAAAGDGRKTAAAATADDAVHAVAMEVRRVTSASAGDALGEHGDNFFEIEARQITIGISAAHSLE